MQNIVLRISALQDIVFADIVWTVDFILKFELNIVNIRHRLVFILKLILISIWLADHVNKIIDYRRYELPCF